MEELTTMVRWLTKNFSLGKDTNNLRKTGVLPAIHRRELTTIRSCSIMFLRVSITSLWFVDQVIHVDNREIFVNEFLDETAKRLPENQDEQQQNWRPDQLSMFMTKVRNHMPLLEKNKASIFFKRVNFFGG